MKQNFQFKKHLPKVFKKNFIGKEAAHVIEK